MALRLDQCIFEILARLGAAELRSLIDFIQAKIELLRREINTIFSLVDLIDDQLAALEEIIGFLGDLLSGKQAISALLALARELGPSCGDVALVFQSPLALVGPAATNAENMLYEARQLLATKSGMREAQAAINEQIDNLEGIVDFIGLFLRNRQVDIAKYTGGAIKPLNDALNTGLSAVSEQTERINEKLRGAV